MVIRDVLVSVIEHPRLVHCLILSITIAISRTFPAQLGSNRSLTEMPEKLQLRHQTGGQSIRTPAFKNSEWQRSKTREGKSL